MDFSDSGWRAIAAPGCTGAERMFRQRSRREEAITPKRVFSAELMHRSALETSDLFV